MSYADFVKKHYDSVRDLPPKERFAAIAKMYHAQKGGKAVKGGMEVAGSLDMPKAKKHSKAHSKTVKGGIEVGGDLMSDIYGTIMHDLSSVTKPLKEGLMHSLYSG